MALDHSHFWNCGNSAEKHRNWCLMNVGFHPTSKILGLWVKCSRSRTSERQSHCSEWNLRDEGLDQEMSLKDNVLCEHLKQEKWHREGWGCHRVTSSKTRAGSQCKINSGCGLSYQTGLKVQTAQKCPWNSQHITAGCKMLPGYSIQQKAQPGGWNHEQKHLRWIWSTTQVEKFHSECCDPMSQRHYEKTRPEVVNISWWIYIYIYRGCQTYGQRPKTGPLGCLIFWAFYRKKSLCHF